MLELIKKNIGAISAIIGFAILTIMTFGDIAKIMTADYWRNVWNNVVGISFISIGLVLVQYTIKQGISEQALSVGLNTENTKNKYEEHKEAVKKNTERNIYLPYFLDEYNRRETKRRRQEFLVNNNYSTETKLYASGNKKLIKIYNKIHTCINAASIKWSSTEVVYKKDGNIETLPEYRLRRARSGIIKAFLIFGGTTLVTTGLIADNLQTSIRDKIIQLVVYFLVIAASVIFDVGKNYEKGKFGVPNELDIVNGIWNEFENWTVPQWVINEIENESKEVKDEERKETVDAATDIQKEFEKEQDIQTPCTL